MSQLTAPPLPTELRRQIRELVDSWGARMTSSAPPDRRATEEALSRLYAQRDLSAPRWYIWTDSPVAARFTVEAITTGRPTRHDAHVCMSRRDLRLPPGTRDHYWDRLDAQVDPDFWTVERRVNDRSLWTLTAEQLHQRVAADPELTRTALLDAVLASPPHDTDPAVTEYLCAKYSAGEQELPLAGWINLVARQRLSVIAGLGDNTDGLCSRYGLPWQHISYPYPASVHPMDLTSARPIHLGVADPAAGNWCEDLGTVFANTSYVQLFLDAVVLGENPTSHTQDKDGRLHNEHGAALGFADGVEEYRWHGTRVTAAAITAPVTLERIIHERNVETRRCLIERLGWPEVVRRAQLTPVGAPVPDPGNDPFTLQLFDLPPRLQVAGGRGRRRRARLLLCTNGTTERDGTRHRYGLLVRAHHTDPVAAAAELYGVSTATYRRMQVRR